jgi:hypothetical protein
MAWKYAIKNVVVYGVGIGQKDMLCSRIYTVSTPAVGKSQRDQYLMDRTALKLRIAVTSLTSSVGPNSSRRSAISEGPSSPDF